MHVCLLYKKLKVRRWAPRGFGFTLDDINLSASTPYGRTWGHYKVMMVWLQQLHNIYIYIYKLCIYIYVCHRVSLVFVCLVEKHHGLICYFVLDVQICNIYIYQHLQRGAKWFCFRVSIHNPLGFKDGTPLKVQVNIYFPMDCHVYTPHHDLTPAITSPRAGDQDFQGFGTGSKNWQFCSTRHIWSTVICRNLRGFF